MESCINMNQVNLPIKICKINIIGYLFLRAEYDARYSVSINPYAQPSQGYFYFINVGVRLSELS